MKVRAVVYGVLVVAVVGLLIWVVGRSESGGQVVGDAVTNGRVGNGNSVASNPGGEEVPQTVPTAPIAVPSGVVPLPRSTGEAPFREPPNAVATQEAIAVLSNTPTPSMTLSPIPPTATPMPIEWAEFERLLHAPNGLYQYMYKLTGVVIAKSEAGPSCVGGLAGYRIEEVALPGPVKFWENSPPVNAFWKLTLVGGPFSEDRLKEAFLMFNGGGTTGWDWMVSDDGAEVGVVLLEPGRIFEGEMISIKYQSGLELEIPEGVHFFDGRPEKANPSPTKITFDYGTPEPETVKRQAAFNALIFSKGTVIAGNVRDHAECLTGINGYSIEEVTLPQALDFGPAGWDVTTDKFWRVNINGVPMPIGNALTPHYGVCIGDQVIDNPNRGTIGLPAYMFDISNIHEGDTIRFGPGIDLAGCNSEYATVLPETLHFLANPTPTALPTLSATEAACVQRLDMYEKLYKNSGKVIAQGSNTLPTCQMKFLTYRVEEIDLPQSTTFALDEGPTTVDRYWRLIIIDEEPIFTGQMGSIGVGGKELPIQRASSDEHEITALVFDRSLLKDGAEITYGTGPYAVTLPERLSMPSTP